MELDPELATRPATLHGMRFVLLRCCVWLTRVPTDRYGLSELAASGPGK